MRFLKKTILQRVYKNFFIFKLQSETTFNISNTLHNAYYINFFKAYSSDCSKEHYDIIISGGGMVGLATGCALGSSSLLENKSILILEKQKKKRWHLPDDFSNRVSALNDQSVQLLNKISVWKHIEELRAQPVKQMQVWESCSEAFITFNEHDVQETIAHIVENDVIIDCLMNQLPENVKVNYDSKICKYELPETTDNLAHVTFEDGKILKTDLLIGADGANSGVRKAMGSKYIAWEYDQMGIVATLQLSEEQDNFIAWQKFLSTGPIALLPLSSQYCSLVWSTTRKRSKELLTLSDVDFIEALNNALWRDEFNPLVQNIHSQWQNLLKILVPGNEVGGVKQLPPSFSGIIENSKAAFPLGLGHAAHYVKPRVALIGDAAHRVHPLAGQGVNLGFGDVTVLLSTLENAIKLGCDIGDVTELYQYETARQRYNITSMAAIDSLYRLYSSKFTPLVLLRSLGLSAVDAIAPIKKRIIAHAAG